MTMSDPIADMLTRIRNANTAKHDTVDIPYSKIKFSIAQILLDEGYVKSVDLVDNGNFKDIRVSLKYGLNTALTRMTRSSQALRESPSPVFAFMLAKIRFRRYLTDSELQSFPPTRVS